MLNSAIVFVVLVILGIFAAGSCEIAAEKAEKRRVEKWIKHKYGRTY